MASYDLRRSTRLTTFKRCVDKYKKILLKTDAEMVILDNDPEKEKFPREWILIGDSAYLEARKLLRYIAVQIRSFNKQYLKKDTTRVFQWIEL